MTVYSFHDLTLEIKPAGPEARANLPELLQALWFARTHTTVLEPSLSLSIYLSKPDLKIPSTAREVFRADGLSGFESADDLYLTEGSSVLHLQPLQGQGEAHLAATFFHRPRLLQQQFWAFGLLRLLRPLGVYGLHAAGAVFPRGRSLLIVGASGSGKSTLAIGLIRQGWGYLSDDAVLLRLQPTGVEALALRKSFSVDSGAAAMYADLPLGKEAFDTPVRRKLRVEVHTVYPTQHVPRCIPQVLLFSRIIPQRQSALHPLDRSSALRYLLTQSGTQLFDRATMGHHLEVLKRLVQQSICYELQAGRDLYHDPGKLVDLLAAAEEDVRWPASLSN